LEQCTYDEKEKICEAKTLKNKNKYGRFNCGRKDEDQDEDQKLYRFRYKQGRQNWMQDMGISKKK